MQEGSAPQLHLNCIEAGTKLLTWERTQHLRDVPLKIAKERAYLAEQEESAKAFLEYLRQDTPLYRKRRTVQRYIDGYYDMHI